MFETARHHKPAPPWPTTPTLKNGQPNATHHPDLSTPAERRAVSELVSVDQVPTSFGVFNPVGWVMVGLPTQAKADALPAAFHARGWPGESVLHFQPRDTPAELAAMVGDAGLLAGFGYEITLLRRYVALAQQGYRWLLVKVSGVEEAASAADIARNGGATLAVHYRALAVEELI